MNIVRKPQSLTPQRDVVLVTGAHVEQLIAADVSAQRVGNKAVGLVSIPAAWTTSFFCVCGAEKPTTKALDKAMSFSGISMNAKLIVRSSGITEDMEDRGQFESAECSQTELLEKLCCLRERISDDTVHWVIQELVPQRAKGHLSNERRIARDKRDWKAEIEAANSAPSETFSVSVRTWRDNRPALETQLVCKHREAIVDQLKIVARWAYERLIRVHFEWVWSGNKLYVVQADPCDDVAYGVNPHELVSSTASTRMPLTHEGLKCFRKANDSDFLTYRKLANAKLYRDLGYEAVPFFVLDNSEEICNLIEYGQCSADLESDLELLTNAPLVIRTDGTKTPDGLRDMLPRSDELRSMESAKDWLLQEFRSKICSANSHEGSLAESELCLIAHHFVPAVAAAWCQAFPDKRRVRIESLWGIPEGLYWYAYDSFDVDTKVMSNICMQGRPSGIAIREKLRYKERFVAPLDNGDWVVQRTSASAGWARSIQKKEWIQEIAWTSRCIANEQQSAVVVMWFIDTAHVSLNHPVMPWFHTKWRPHNQVKAVPRIRRRAGKDFLLRKNIDWENLKDKIKAGHRFSRICVDPVEPEMVRNQNFVREFAAFAKTNDMIVELRGGILSHAYYMLSREGCDVECAELDSYAIDEEALEFNKLVRDLIPDAISSRGENVEKLQLSGNALVVALRRKLVEEAFEVLDAQNNDQIAEEIADLWEVATSLMDELGIDIRTVNAARLAKLRKSGGFKKGLMLKSTSMSPTLAGGLSAPTDFFTDDTEQSIEIKVNNASDLPLTAPDDLHVDLRYGVDGKPERQLTASIPTHAEGFSPPVASFGLPTIDGHIRGLAIAVEIDRNQANLKFRIRLTNAPEQLSFDL